MFDCCTCACTCFLLSWFTRYTLRVCHMIQEHFLDVWFKLGHVTMNVYTILSQSSKILPILYELAVSHASHNVHFMMHTYSLLGMCVLWSILLSVHDLYSLPSPLPSYLPPFLPSFPPPLFSLYLSPCFFPSFSIPSSPTTSYPSLNTCIRV